MPAEQLAQLFEVLEGGGEVTGEVIQFPVDAAGAGAETSLAGEGVSTLVQMGNGATTEVSQLTVGEGAAATASGVGLLAMDVGTAGAAIAPALGVLAGVGLYNLAPEFWTNVSNKLVAAGQTVAGKVRAFLDGDTKQVYLSQETVEIFKESFIEEGIFDSAGTADSTGISSDIIPDKYRRVYNITSSPVHQQNAYSNYYLTFTGSSPIYAAQCFFSSGGHSTAYIYLCSLSPFSLHEKLDGPFKYDRDNNSDTLNFNNKTFYAQVAEQCLSPTQSGFTSTLDVTNMGDRDNDSDRWIYIAYSILFGQRNIASNTQEGATLPSKKPIPDTYPDWDSRSKPIPGSPKLKMYPIEIPVNNPDADQNEAQNPNPSPEPAPWLEWLVENLPQPAPNLDPNPQPLPQPEPDPDPQPEPEPLPSEGGALVPPDPPDPNPDPEVPPLPVVPVLPSTVDSNAMFTVYSPSLSQLNSFGGWLWNSNIVEQILRMWQNPLDGIIAFMKVYATPTTGANRNIQVGYLDSGISAPVVTSQFATVDCGTVKVNENKHNATDYTPYVSIHLYLPFIGIVELDPDEFMNGSINVKYSIDVYTGTCLAEVRCTRHIDMPKPTVLYTFSGNASQQLPLTSSNFGGVLSSLISAVGGGIMIASGGGVEMAAGAAALGHSLTHEMVHVGHSGGLSGNAGIMASRKPYIIISRRHGYDANNYADEYGYPANKTVYLGNCSGYTRVKAGHLKCRADSIEKEEIMSLLKKGVIL